MITLRPHHVLCIQRFIGEGYSPSFVENMWKIVNSIKEAPQQSINFIGSEDDLCAHCPHNQNGCVSEAKVRRMDKLVGLSGTMAWSDAVSHCSKLDAKEICTNCQWYKLCHG